LDIGCPTAQADASTHSWSQNHPRESVPFEPLVVTAILTRRALNRALLERRLLLRRATMPVHDALEHLVGMQAQAPLSPYVGLWSRLEGFRFDALAERIAAREAVRAMTMLRGTIHLVTAGDSLAIRPILQPVLERAFRASPFARNVIGLDMDELLAAGQEHLDQRPMTIAELATLLGERWPDPRRGLALLRCPLPLAPRPGSPAQDLG
jgi:hypothetical protein